MKRLALLLVLAGCVDDSDPPWQLDHDRILAVRIDPPAILTGEVARLDALLAHAGGPTTTEQPIGVTAAGAPAELFTVVHFNLDHWEIDGPPEAQLAQARAELGLADDAPVPIDVKLQFPGPLYATKTVYLGTSYGNPTARVTLDGADVPASLALTAHRAYRFVVDAPRAHWFTSCGELRGHDQLEVTLVTGEACSGELVLVGRDDRGGTMWQVISLSISL
ncbi:MAG: hypothetical protein HOV81_10115 [Kofleriaceae bacterium]|nr:hypothetical protein [Kofleriaceae bacterium]